MVTTPVKFYAAAVAPTTMASGKHHLQYRFFLEPDAGNKSG